MYVAMTRARERLIVTAKCSGTPDYELTEAREALQFTDKYSVLTSNRMIDHVLSAIAENGISNCRITAVLKSEKENEITEIPLNYKEESIDNVAQYNCNAIAENLNFIYAHGHMTTLPSKLAVSGLYPEVLDGSLSEGERAAAIEDLDETVDIDETVVAPEEDMPLPKFISGSVDYDPAEKGTSTHVFLQFADFAALRESGVRGEIERLTEAGFITPKMASMVSVAQVEKFAHSEIVERFFTSPMSVREFRFNVLLPASSFTSDNNMREKFDSDKAEITVQGVFDCVFEDSDGKLVLLDYKTDAMNAYELRHPEAGREKLRLRHTRQLSYYAEAVKLLFGKSPDEVYVYSLPLGEAVPISVN